MLLSHDAAISGVVERDCARSAIAERRVKHQEVVQMSDSTTVTITVTIPGSAGGYTLAGPDGVHTTIPSGNAINFNYPPASGEAAMTAETLAAVADARFKAMADLHRVMSVSHTLYENWHAAQSAALGA
jgi:hypothetical protein